MWIICIIICISPVYLMQFGMINVFFQCAPGISSSTPTLTLLCTLPAYPAFIVRCPKTSHLLVNSRRRVDRLMPLSGKDSLNFLFMGASTALIAHGALARNAEGANSYMRLHPFFMAIAFSLMISLGFWM